MSRLTWCVLLAVAASGCRRNDNFCESANPNNNCSEIDAAIDSPMACTTSAECTPQVCDLTGSMTCVQCTPGEDAACTGTTPACVSNTCQACTSHAQCDSAVCLSDGSCATENEVAYVSPNGTDNATCTQATPCTKVTKALATNRKLVKFTGITDEGGTVVVDNQNVALVAEPNA